MPGGGGGQAAAGGTLLGVGFVANPLRIQDDALERFQAKWIRIKKTRQNIGAAVLIPSEPK
ncbi:MAG: hypothetical protein ACREDL_02240, partial [Bradyrhizobium sp.]